MTHIDKEGFNWTIDDLRIYREAKENGIGTIQRFIKEVKKYVEIKDP